MPQKILNGPCRGGPWDGQMLEHYKPEYRMMKREPIRYLDPELPPLPPTHLMLSWGSYRYVAGNWVWRDDDANC